MVVNDRNCEQGCGIYLSTKPDAIKQLANDLREKNGFWPYLNTFKLNTFLKRIIIKKITYVVDL